MSLTYKLSKHHQMCASSVIEVSFYCRGTPFHQLRILSTCVPLPFAGHSTSFQSSFPVFHHLKFLNLSTVPQDRQDNQTSATLYKSTIGLVTIGSCLSTSRVLGRVFCDQIPFQHKLLAIISHISIFIQLSP